MSPTIMPSIPASCWSRSAALTQLRTIVIALVLASAALCPAASQAFARSDATGFMSTLNASDRDAFNAWFTARTFFNAQRDAFWDKVYATRRERRRRIRKGQPITKANYVLEFPPEYEGPKLSKSLKRRWQAYKAKKKKDKPKKKRKGLPDVNDFLAYAKKYYGFVPDRISETEFKRRYAREALRLGLSKEQVVRVYALETGGNGTADMQAGINPISKRGRPISSALGYAQLLHANSTSEFYKHGDEFIERLEKIRDTTNDAERRRRIANKLPALRRMLKKVKSIPYKWSRHMKFGRTGPGLGIHAINLDGDIGPWLQVIKLKGIKRFAERKGRDNLDSTQLELMNLAGPGTGIEMMTPLGMKMPTVNFFSRIGYERNSVVRGRTSAGLLKELGRRMDYNIRNSGAREFERVFDELLEARRASR